MKKLKHILWSILLLCTALVCQAQPDWNTWGNGGTSILTDFVGTTDNTRLQFTTNGTFPVQMVLDVNGQLGIGTVTPANKLTVSGNADVTGNLGVGVVTPRTALDVNGTITAKQIIIESNNTQQDLLALVLKLQNEIDQLKQQLTITLKN